MTLTRQKIQVVLVPLLCLLYLLLLLGFNVSFHSSNDDSDVHRRSYGSLQTLWARASSRQRRSATDSSFSSEIINVTFTALTPLNPTTTGTGLLAFEAEAVTVGLTFNITDAFWQVTSSNTYVNINGSEKLANYTEADGSILMSKAEIKSGGPGRRSSATFQLSVWNATFVPASVFYHPVVVVNGSNFVSPFSFSITLDPTAISSTTTASTQTTTSTMTASASPASRPSVSGTAGTGGGSNIVTVAPVGGNTVSTATATVSSTIPPPTTTTVAVITAAPTSTSPAAAASPTTVVVTTAVPTSTLPAVAASPTTGAVTIAVPTSTSPAAATSNTTAALTPLLTMMTTTSTTVTDSSNSSGSPSVGVLGRDSSASESRIGVIVGVSVPVGLVGLIALAGFGYYYKTQRTGSADVPSTPRTEMRPTNAYVTPATPGTVADYDPTGSYIDAIYMGEGSVIGAEDIYAAASSPTPMLPKEGEATGATLNVANTHRGSIRSAGHSSIYSTAVSIGGVSTGEDQYMQCPNDSLYSDLPAMADIKQQNDRQPTSDCDVVAGNAAAQPQERRSTQESMEPVGNTGPRRISLSGKQAPEKPARKELSVYSSSSTCTSPVRITPDISPYILDPMSGKICQSVKSAEHTILPRDSSEQKLDQGCSASPPSPDDDLYDMPSRSALPFGDGSTLDLLGSKAAGSLSNTSLLLTPVQAIYDLVVASASPHFPEEQFDIALSMAGPVSTGEKVMVVEPMSAAFEAMDDAANSTPARHDSLGYMAPKDYRKLLGNTAESLSRISDASGLSPRPTEDVIYCSVSRASPEGLASSCSPETESVPVLPPSRKPKPVREKKGSVGRPESALRAAKSMNVKRQLQRDKGKGKKGSSTVRHRRNKAEERKLAKLLQVQHSQKQDELTEELKLYLASQTGTKNVVGTEDAGVGIDV